MLECTDVKVFFTIWIGTRKSAGVDSSVLQGSSIAKLSVAKFYESLIIRTNTEHFSVRIQWSFTEDARCNQITHTYRAMIGIYPNLVENFYTGNSNWIFAVMLSIKKPEYDVY